jgi:hypothetical protein
MSPRGSAKPSPSACAGVEVVAAEQAALPEFAHALRRCGPCAGTVGRNAAGGEQIGDGPLEGGGIEGVAAGDADAGAGT